MLTHFSLTLSLLFPAAFDIEPSRSSRADRQGPLSPAAKESFLRTAEITNRENLSVGVTESQRLTLSNGDLTHHAHLQTVDRIWKKFTTGGRTYLNFQDSYRFNIAAYRLDRLLGLDMVPVSVERRVGGRRSAVTWWVDDVQMMELDRRSSGAAPPDLVKWSEQVGRIRVFNQWVANVDPNMTNILITDDWDLWQVDFTRAFNTTGGVRGELPPRIERALFARLAGLTAEELEGELRDVLSKSEIRALLKRRDRIVDYYRGRLAELGESIVFREPTVSRRAA